MNDNPQEFKRAYSVESLAEGEGRYQVFTPFGFGDGDHFVIILKSKENGEMFLTDEGHTYMHLSYREPMSPIWPEVRDKAIEDALKEYGVQEREGELTIAIDKIDEASDALHNFVQCLIQIARSQ